MRIGDIVKRSNSWTDFNPWMDNDEITELGMITLIEKGRWERALYVVLWSTTGLSWERIGDIELVQ